MVEETVPTYDYNTFRPLPAHRTLNTITHASRRDIDAHHTFFNYLKRVEHENTR